MEVKFTITCKQCGCCAQFKSNGLPPANPLACQSCGQVLPDDCQAALTEAMSALRVLPHDTAPYGWGDVKKQGFKIALETDHAYPTQED